jgi:hypothetical protein
MTARPARNWPWRDYLTPAERDRIERADRLREELAALTIDRPKIVNRAIQRAKYAARAAEAGQDADAGGRDE